MMRALQGVIASSYRNAIPQDYSLHYSMDNISGSTLVDESANSYDGAITGATPTTGQVGDALNFTTDEVSIPSGLQLDNDFTIACWFKVNGVQSGQAVFASFGKSTTGERRALWVESFSGEFYVSGFNANLSSGIVVTDSTYRHAIVTVTSGYFVSIYIGNSLVASGTLGWSTPSSWTNYLGRSDYTGGEYPSNIDIDEFYVYERVVTAQERAAIYNG